MEYKDFSVGLEFWMSGAKWRCTDIGQRVVIAIILDDREDQSWFEGPPYAVPERVIDTYEFAICSLIEDPRATAARKDADRRRRDMDERGPHIAWCDEHASTGGTMRCATCGMLEMSSALSQIDCLLVPADENGIKVSLYDLDCDPQGVLNRVSEALGNKVRT